MRLAQGPLLADSRSLGSGFQRQLMRKQTPIKRLQASEFDPDTTIIYGVVVTPCIIDFGQFNHEIFNDLTHLGEDKPNTNS